MKLVASPSTQSTLLLARALIHAAQERDLHPAIQRALVALGRAQKRLEAKRSRAAEKADAAAKAASLHLAMTNARRRFAALGAVLRAYATMPEGEPMGDYARVALDGMLRGGTSFLSGSIEQIVVDGEEALARGRAKDVAKALAEVHCQPLVALCAASVKELAAAHVLRASEPAKDDEPGYAARNAAVDAIRDYAHVVEAAALLDPTTPADELLSPIRHAVAKAKAKAKTKHAEHDVPAVTDEAPPSVAA